MYSTRAFGKKRPMNRKFDSVYSVKSSNVETSWRIIVPLWRQTPVVSMTTRLIIKSVIMVQFSFWYMVNPFNTKPMAKIAVKMSIMRVVKFMSSWDNYFTSWPKHHQLFFGGQSVELPLSLHWFSWLPPGGYQGLSMWEIWSKHSQSFDVCRTLTATGVKGYRNRVSCISQVMRPWESSDTMHTPGVTQQILSEITNQKLKNVKFWCMDEGVLPPETPINPYLGANMHEKNMSHILHVCSFTHTLDASVWS